MSSGADGFLNFFLKIVANYDNADNVSSPIAANGTSGCGFLKASVISFAAISNLSMEEIFGIGEL
jgi:hypothetical protein